MENITIIPSENPGAFERHLIRREENQLFSERKTEVNSDTLLEVQQKDHEVLSKFMTDFQETMGKVVAFKPNEESDEILGVKDSLDKLYATSVVVADDQAKIQYSIKKLIDVIMVTVRKGAGTDAHALQELEQEDMAREANFKFLESKLVADLLDPDSPIDDVDLIPTLLSAEKDDLALATQLFDIEQTKYLLTEGEALLDKLQAEGVDVRSAAENYVFIQGYLTFLEQNETEAGTGTEIKFT